VTLPPGSTVSLVPPAEAELVPESMEETVARYQAIERARDADAERRRRELPAMQTPPEGKCCRQKPSLGTWPSRYARIKPNGSGGMGLYVYAAQGDRNPRATSIENLQGCTFMKAMENFTFSVCRPALRLS
jgi:hypothetical protein